MTLEETHCSFDHFADDRYLLNYNNLLKKINKIVHKDLKT